MGGHPGGALVRTRGILDNQVSSLKKGVGRTVTRRGTDSRFHQTLLQNPLVLEDP